MPIQTTYDERLAIGVAGQISSSIPNTVITGRAEEVIPFGRAVIQGTGDRDFKNLADAGDTVIGISIREQSIDVDTINAFPVNENVGALTIGEILVVADSAVSAGPVVHALVNGNFASTGGALIPDASFVTSGAAGELVKIRLK